MAIKEKQVLIPLGIFEKLMELLNRLEEKVYENSSEFELDDEAQFYILYMLENLRHKKDKMDLRKKYAGMIFAENEDERFDSGIDYLSRKNEVKNSPYF